ncbi:MAG: family 10 glycosylhydrolase [Rhodothermaceae bacterium]|nr:family 10 glycosylhydrolase [Rhodothermaceae bacterium]
MKSRLQPRAGVDVFISILLILVISVYPGLVQSQPVEELRAVKITNVDSQVLFSDEGIAAAMDFLAETGINAVLPVVQNAGWTQYPSGVMEREFGIPIDPRFAGRDPLGVLVREARRVGIEVYPWFEYGFASIYSGGTPPHGGHIIAKNPHWATFDRNGNHCTKNGFDWMNGIHPEVQDHIIALAMEIIDNYDIDGIEFSDRMPAMPVECGYDDYTTTLYRSEHDGADPPFNFRNPAWRTWRAGKLNDFYSRVRDSVKTRDPELFVASSPSVYPWAFSEYLQDPPSWISNGTIDHWIPQFYRQNLAAYQIEVDRAVEQAGDHLDILIAGILMNVGSYTVPVDSLRLFMESNRVAGIRGEGFFFYEGLRKNSNELAAFLKEEFYTHSALIPGRKSFERRPAAAISRPESPGTDVTGTWLTSNNPGFDGTVWVFDPEGSSNGSITYALDVPEEAWYDLYVWTTPGENFTDTLQFSPGTVDGNRLRFTTETGDGGTLKIPVGNGGWQHAGTLYIDSSTDDTTVSILSSGTDGKPAAADAVMAAVNRKLSPGTAVSIEQERIAERMHPGSATIKVNYPNPFNPTTTIVYSVTEPSRIRITVHDLLGRTVATLTDAAATPGSHTVMFDAAGYASGLYMVRIYADGKPAGSRKIMLIR